MSRSSSLARVLILPLMLSVTVLTGCGEGGPSPDVEFGPAIGPTDLTYADELGVDLDAMERTDAGVYYRDDVVGDGAVANVGSTIRVHYTGYFPDGTSFDTSRGTGDGFTVEIGTGNVIPGWDDGVPGMREGGQRILVVPPQMAYGEAGAGGVIPPYAVLVFEVELMEVEEE